jgi:hypothetical protein
MAFEWSTLNCSPGLSVVSNRRTIHAHSAEKVSIVETGPFDYHQDAMKCEAYCGGERDSIARIDPFPAAESSSFQGPFLC